VNCRLFRHTIGHFLFAGCPKEFVVDAPNHWNSYQVQTTNLNVVGKPYDVLAENEKTESLVLEHKNSIMCIFKVAKEYKESVTILTNFILHFLDKIQFGQRLDVPLETAQRSRTVNENENPDQRIRDMPAKRLQNSIASMSPRCTDATSFKRRHQTLNSNSRPQTVAGNKIFSVSLQVDKRAGITSANPYQS
jgi:hypothetical protein